MDELMIHDAAAAVFRLIDATNQFIAGKEPWKLAKDPARADELSQVLFDAAEAIRLAAVLLMPIMPSSSAEILRRVGVSGRGLNLDRDGAWRNDGERAMSQDGPLWPRAEAGLSTVKTKERSVTDELVPPAAGAPSEPGANVRSASDPDRVRPGQGSPPQQPSAATADRISIDEFMKVELCVARVLAAEPVPKSSKLLKLSVDVGTEQRTIVAGIADAYEPEALVGRTVVVVVNLKPAKLMGVESNGMVLAASPEGGKPELLGFEEPPPPGTRVR
jgi:methionyl-tRNA synthetase